MKHRVLYISIMAALQSMGGCTVVPASTAVNACQLLDTATREADLAPAWYIGAGQVLESCGQQQARKDGEVRACYAEARNGYRDSQECEAMQ